MSQFQSNILFWAILIAILWLYFCIGILDIDTYVWVLWALSSLTLGLWLWWNQKAMGFIWGILSILTAWAFVFSIIPVYNYKPTLDVFYATQIPSIQCNDSVNGTIYINTLTISMADICKRWKFPLLVEQRISSTISGWVTINLWFGNSAIIYNWYKWVLTRIDNNWQSQYTLSTTQAWDLTPTQWVQNPIQSAIRQSYLQNKKDYLQKNFPWAWEYAPSMTKIALRKMRLLSLIDRSYNDKISSLEYYLQEIQ